MLTYLGPELLQSVLEHYEHRYQLALERGYADESSQYYWLFDEIRDRILIIRQAEIFLYALPLFMQQGDEENALQYVVSYVGGLCAALTTGAGDSKTNVGEYSTHKSNPYWKQANEVLDRLREGYDLNNLPLLYMDLSEYLVRTLRYYFYMREQRCQIDRGKFDEIMQLNYYMVV